MKIKDEEVFSAEGEQVCFYFFTKRTRLPDESTTVYHYLRSIAAPQQHLSVRAVPPEVRTLGGTRQQTSIGGDQVLTVMNA